MTGSDRKAIGTYLIASSCLLLLLSFGYRSGFGLFVKPISEANSWGREVISMALAIQNLFWGVVSVFAGGLADRFGNVKVVIGGTILYAAGMALMAGVDSPWLLHTSAGVLVGSGIAGTAFGIVLPAMARAVGEERRQWALGVGTAAGSLGQFALVPVAQQLMDSYGWINALYILAASALFMAVLAMPLAPYSGAREAQDLKRDQSIREALTEAFGHRSYMLLTFGFFVCGFHVAFIGAHLPAFLSDAGFEPKVGAWSISIIGLFNVFGAYYAGVISGKWSRRNVLVWIYLGRAVVITVFLLTPLTLTTVLVFSATMGFLWLATVPPTSGLVAVMFGTRYMALLYGFVFLSHQLGSFLGVWLGGWLYDRHGTYDAVWWTGVVLGVVAAVLHWPISERPVARLASSPAV
uniref:Major facilitator superfamily permease n=1 Tax=uncultured marine thaumarchaeote KM3_61_F08 TaxID=1456214 RepID=A0A075HFR2_9ARCH|nr:major facilitator superfamily permease [uncultured marine thaumarchaeote KM3_61_F08]